MIRRPPRSTRTGHTLSLHDALPILDRLEAEVAVQPARIDHRVRIGILLVEIDVIGGAGDDHREGVAEHALLEVEFVVEIVRIDHPHARKALGDRTEIVEEIDVVVLVDLGRPVDRIRSEEHTSELQSLMCISSAVFCLTKTPNNTSSPYTI